MSSKIIMNGQMEAGTDSFVCLVHRFGFKTVVIVTVGDRNPCSLTNASPPRPSNMAPILMGMTKQCLQGKIRSRAAN